MQKLFTLLLTGTVVVMGVGIGVSQQSSPVPPAKRAAPPHSSLGDIPAVKGVSNQGSAELEAEIAEAWSSAREALGNAQKSYDAGDYLSAEALARKSIALAPSIRGQRQDPMGAAYLLIGDARMEMGDYAGALSQYEVGAGTTWRPAENLNVALCYSRLGKAGKARAMYSDEMILGYGGIAKADLPGTANAASLQASILLARGLDRYFASRWPQALKDFEAAQAIVPKNAVAAYYKGMALSFMNRRSEAVASFETAAATGSGAFTADAKSRSR